MQILTNVSKYLLLAVLSGSLLIALNLDNRLDIASSITDTINTDNATSDSVWASLRNEFKLDHKTQSAAVQAQIHELLSDRDDLNRILQAAAPYIYFIHQQIQQKGLPAEIALIPFIESEFNPYDHSNKGATGLWQLMSGTAHELGVKVKSGYDGRRNIISSTQAALAYFKDLGVGFKGNWYLAIAAYNCGQGKVEHAVHRAGTDNFWDLSLPKETESYVPKLLAVAAIIEDPAKYGVQLPIVENKPFFTEVKVSKPVNLTKLAQATDMNEHTLTRLNPDLKNGASAPKAKEGSYTLLVPITEASAAKDQLQKTKALAA